MLPAYLNQADSQRRRERACRSFTRHSGAEREDHQLILTRRAEEKIGQSGRNRLHSESPAPHAKENRARGLLEEPENPCSARPTAPTSIRAMDILLVAGLSSTKRVPAAGNIHADDGAPIFCRIPSQSTVQPITTFEREREHEHECPLARARRAVSISLDDLICHSIHLPCVFAECCPCGCNHIALHKTVRSPDTTSRPSQCPQPLPTEAINRVGRVALNCL